MNQIAIIGTGRMGEGLAKVIGPAVNSLIIASRDIDKANELIKRLDIPSLKATSIDEALLAADIIIPTLWFAEELTFAKSKKDSLKDKLYINISVPFNATFDDLILPYGASAAEEIQKIIPETKVAGAFKNIFWKVYDNPIHSNNIPPDVYVTSDDLEARQLVMNLFKPLPFRFIDAGSLEENRTIERMTLFSRKISLTAGNYPRIAFHLWGL